MLINNRTQPLLPILQTNIAWADKVTICVAFFRNTGLQEILKDLKKKPKGSVKIIAGVGFYQTEPVALMAAFNNGFKIFLQKEKSKKTFHPKVYLFQKGKKYRAIIGSSNMTKGGLVNNVEMSFAFDSTKDGATIKELKEELEIITNDLENFNQVENKLVIENYRVKFEKYKKIVAPAIKRAKKVVEKIHKFEVSKFLRYVNNHRMNLHVEFKRKADDYSESKKEMKIISRKKYKNANQFLKDFNEVHFDSAGIRRGEKTYRLYYQNIQKLIELADKSDTRNMVSTFEKSMKIMKKIKGMGMNNVTEILNVFRPKIFPVLNGRTLSVLQSLGLATDKSSQSFKVDDYLEYVEVMLDIKKQCGFEDFRETDLAISHYYRDEVKK